MDVSKQPSVARFLGVNNVDEMHRLFPVERDVGLVYPAREANNLDIDNTYAISSRSPYTQVLAGTDIHSLWSDGKRCFFVDGAVLYELDVNYNKTVITTASPNARMVYVPVNDRYYFTNGMEIGYIKGSTAYACMDPSREFKAPLPAGSHIEYFMGCLYVSARNILYISDPLCDYYDTRIGYRIFTDEITMIRAVDNGLYVSDKEVWFVQGKGNDEFRKSGADSEPAIPYTDVKISAKNMGLNAAGDVAIWTSASGICIGDDGGAVRNITKDQYHMPEHGRGAAFVRNNENVIHYVNTLF